MRTCPQCGVSVPNAEAQFCPSCGMSLWSAPGSYPPNPSAEPGAVPYPPAPTAPWPSYGTPAAPSQPMYPQSPYGAPTGPSQPLYGQPPYGQPPYGQPPYGTPAAPSQPMYGQPPYGPGYGAPGGYPGAYMAGANGWPAATPQRPPWRRIISGVVGALLLIAVITNAYLQLHARQMSRASTTAMATAQVTSGTTLLTDSLKSDTNGWPNDTHCYFDQAGYHIADGYVCYAPIGSQTDGTEAVTIKQVSGPTTYPYGLVFRRVSKGNYYFFGVDSNSKWLFAKLSNGVYTNLQDFTPDDAIHGGLNQENSLMVKMSGSTFDCYVNGQKVGTIHDSTYAEGKWGLTGATTANIVFTDFIAKR